MTDHSVPHELGPDCGHDEDVNLDLPEAEPGIELPPEEYERILEQARMAPAMGYAMTTRRDVEELESEGRRAFAELENIARALEAIDTGAAAGAMRRRLDTSGGVLGELTILAHEAEHERRRLEDYDRRIGDAHAVIRGLDQQLGQARAEVNEPRLGCATTVDLLHELRARLDFVVAHHTGPGGVDRPGHPERKVREAAMQVIVAIGNLIVDGTPDVLEYRTVDG